MSIVLFARKPLLTRLTNVVRNLWPDSAPGLWYEPGLNGTVYQDSAGTTPGAAGLPAGLVLDKSGRGNNATQTTSAARPVLSARVNLLLLSQDFTGEFWSKVSVTLTKDYAEAPDGTMTASLITFTAPESYLVQSLPVSAAPGVQFTCSFHSKSSVNLVIFGGATPAGTDTATSADIGGGWFRHSRTRTFTVTTTGHVQSLFTAIGSGMVPQVIWGAQLEKAPAVSNYQRVNTATDYDSVGFPFRLDYDGIDDAMGTTFPSALGSNCTIARAIPGVGAQILTGQTIGTTFTQTTTHAGMIIVDRPLTASETTAVTGYLNRRAGV